MNCGKVRGKEQRMGRMGGCKSRKGVKMEGERWSQSDGEREGGEFASSSGGRGGEQKICGEVMAVMNSSWLISRSQVGVWRLDFNTALRLCLQNNHRERSKLGIISYNKSSLCPSALDEAILTNLPCLACSVLCWGEWIIQNNSNAS